MHTESVIEAGRSAFQRGDWGAAYAALTAADDDAGLPIEDLERLATTAYLVGDEQRFVELMSRVHREAMQAGDPVTAAHAAFWVAFSLSDRGHTAQASGWLSRGEAALGSTPGRSAAQGYLLALRAVQQNAEGQPQAALEMFTEVHEYGRRFADPDLLAFGRLGQGQALVMLGEVEQGVSYLDEVMVAVTAEEVSAMVSGLVYCGVIEACHSTFDVGRAREWTGALTQWCDKQPDLVPYRGDCLVHRAQILQLNGNWALAMTEADRARALLAPLHGNPLQGAALYEKAEVHRLRGELSQAEECYREAGERGHEAQPGLALLRLAQGRPDQGLAGIRRALDEAKPSVNRPRLLAAHVELSLAAGDVATARQFSDELDQVARGVGAPFLEALACRSQAAVLLAEGEPRAALTSARHAWQLWRQLDVPFEAARSRVLVGLASRRLGDLDTAQVELSAARTTLEQLGAVTELRALAQLDPTARQRDSVLTPRELEVLRLVAAGKSNRMIASDLVLSDKTVARHLANIFVKLDVTSRAAATAYAYQHQLVYPPDYTEPTTGVPGGSCMVGPTRLASAEPSVEGMELSVAAGVVSTVIFVVSMVPMLVKAARTKELQSYSLGNMLLTNAGNLVHSVYVFSLPPGPIWAMHSFYLVTTATMLVWYLRYTRQPTSAGTDRRQESDATEALATVAA